MMDIIIIILVLMVSGFVGYAVVDTIMRLLFGMILTIRDDKGDTIRIHIKNGKSTIL